MKVVLKLDLDGDKQKQKAFEAVSTLHGIDSIAVDLKVRRMTVVGAVDPADVLKKLRNSFPATDIVSVEPAKEEKRKDAVEIQTLHGYPHHPPLPGGSGEHPHLVTAELPSPRKTVELPERSTEAPVCALVDAMYRLPAKLDGLLRHGHMLPKGSEHEIPLIKQDLEVMIAVLHDYSNSGAENCAMMIECLMKEVRELSYDIEDCIDQYEQAVDSMSGSVFRIPRRQITRRKSKTSRLPKKLKQRLSMANKIREFSMRSQEALQRYSLFNPDGICTSSTRCDVSFGSWHPTPYVEHADHLVGIDDPTNRLEAWLTRDGEQKKFVSILGSGGVGKTTLANELYHRIGWQFECRAFVRTCQKPDIRKLLISMLSQVRPNQPPGDWKVHGLIADIRTHLQDKRYLIVVDDVWATSTWDIVNCALPDGNRCSRILITTEIDDVAQKCCGYDLKYVFKMKPLGEDDSRKLFLSTVVGPPESSEVSNSIIRKCGGLPLATVTIASLLASRIGKPEQWDYINKSLGYGLRMNPTFEGMKQVLNLSYNNLPQHLKPCMLYLSIYQEDYIIWKDDLVKQWIAEGFICATEGKDEEEISRSYFDELMSSRMIQPVHINDTDEILSCTVHYMVLNFIKHKSIVENFVTAIDYSQTSTRLADKVRRLSLQFGNAEDATPPTNMRLSQVRTLAFFGVFKRVPSIVEFRLLQVLILHLWGDEESISFDLSRISELFRLRYLQVTCNVTLELQIQMQGLQYLETLKIDARVSTVPSNIVHLPGLLYLSLPVETNLPNGIGRMASLRTLGYFDLSSNSIDNVQSIGELTNLQDLQLTCSTVPSDYLESKMNSMGLILAKLGNLKSLTLEPSSILDAGPSSMSISCDVWSSISSPPALLQRLEWLPHICTFSSLPKWIGHLGKLCILKFGIRELARNDVDLLRGLPALTVLSLYVRTKPAERIVFGKGGFLVLKHFEFRCCVPCLQFEAYSMPNLRKLKLGFDAHGADQQGSIPVGFEHLSGLKEICAKIGGARANEPGRRSAESALGDAIRMHPGRPTVNIQCVDRMFGGKDYQNTRIQEEEHMTLQKQYELIEEDSNEQHVGLQKGSREDADSRISTLLDLQIPLNKKLDEHNDDKLEHAIEVVVNKHADIGLNRESHGSSSSRPGLNRGSHGSSSRPGRLRRNSLPNLSVLASVLEDGYRWRKYGQKVIQNAKHPKSYYRCEHRTTQGCIATKMVQRTDGDPKLFNITYIGNHTCVRSTHPLPQPGQEQSSFSLGIKAEGSVQGLQTPMLSPFGAAGSRSLGCFSASPMSVETSESQVTDEAVSGSRAGASSMSAATSESQVTHEAVSGSRAGASSMSAATSESQVTHEAVSGSRAGASSMSAATSESQVTHEAVSGSRAGASFMSAATSESQVTHEAVSGSRARASSMSAATSESQVTHEAVSGSRAGASAMSAATSESQVTHEAVSGRSFVHVRGDIGEPGYQ